VAREAMLQHELEIKSGAGFDGSFGWTIEDHGHDFYASLIGEDISEHKIERSSWRRSSELDEAGYFYDQKMDVEGAMKGTMRGMVDLRNRRNTNYNSLKKKDTRGDSGDHSNSGPSSNPSLSRIRLNDRVVHPKCLEVLKRKPFRDALVKIAGTNHGSSEGFSIGHLSRKSEASDPTTLLSLFSTLNFKMSGTIQNRL
jgi:hypothetical protein